MRVSCNNTFGGTVISIFLIDPFACHSATGTTKSSLVTTVTLFA